MTDYEENFSLLRTKLTLNIAPFYMSIMLKLAVVWDEKIPTACVDGITLIINPKFWMSLSEPKRIFVLLHETLHVALMHMTRGAGLHPRIYNLAADYVINQFIEDHYVGSSAVECELWEHALIDPQFIGMTTEEVYNKLMEEVEKYLKLSLHSTDVKEAKAEDVIQIQATVIQAQQSDNGFSTLPAELAALCVSILRPKVNWRAALNRFLTQRISDSTSYENVSRRHIGRDIYLPGKALENKAGDVLIYIDASGSVSSQDFSQLFSEMKSIHSTLNPTSINYKTFTTEIGDEYELVKDGAFYTPELHGGGGTDLTCVIDDINNYKKPIELVIIMSDMYCGPYDGPINKSIPLLALIINNDGYEFPYGTSVFM